MSTLIDTLGKGCMVMWKRIIIACMTLMSAVLIGYHHYHTNISAATMASGGAVTGNLGPLKAGDRFYIFTNNYPFVVVGNELLTFPLLP